MTAVSGIITNKNVVVSKTKSDTEYKNLTYRNITTMSSQNNVYWFLIDRFDERYAEQAYAEDPTIFDNLSGFTWFQDYASKYYQTFPSVVGTLTNNDYDEELLRKEYLKKAYEGNTPLKILYDNGYKVNLYTQEYYCYDGVNSLPDYFENYEKIIFKTTTKIKIPLRMIQLAVFRCAPLFVKKIVGNVSSETLNSYVQNETSDGELGYNGSTKNLWDKISENEFKIDGEKRFSFIHFEGCHDTRYDRNWNRQAEYWDESIITDSVVNSFKIISKFIDNLKANGLYENATIVINGDHGHGGRINAGMLAKMSGSSTEPIKKSKAQVSEENIWKTIFDSENIDSGLELKRGLFEISETETVVRHCKVYGVSKKDELTVDYYDVVGACKDRKNWTLKETKKFNHGFMD